MVYYKKYFLKRIETINKLRNNLSDEYNFKNWKLYEKISLRKIYSGAPGNHTKSLKIMLM